MSLGLGGSYGHNFRTINLPELFILMVLSFVMGSVVVAMAQSTGVGCSVWTSMSLFWMQLVSGAGSS